MGSLTRYTQKKFLDHVLKTAAYSTVPASVYVALSTADPTDSGSGWAEATYTNYARQALTFAAAGTPTPRAIAQSGTIVFPLAGVGAPVAVTHWGIFDVGTTSPPGNLMAYGTLGTSKTIVQGNTPSIASGQIVITVSAGGIFTTQANKMLDFLFRAQAFAQPTHVYMALSTTIPTDGGPNFTEPSNGYTQIAQDSWVAATTATPSVTTNNGEVDFPAPSGSWSTIVYMGVYLDTDPTFYMDVVDQPVTTGDTVKVLTNTATITLD